MCIRDSLEPFVTRTVETLDQALTAYFMKRPVDIYAELQSADKFVKGQALEAFAIYIMRLLGLRFVDWRKRGTETGGTELDVIMTGQFGPVPTVWQIWCKNTPSGRVRLGDIAKEVGLVPQTSATHIMFLANCPISRDAVRFAREVIQLSLIHI